MAKQLGNFVQDLRLPKNFHRELRFIRLVRKYGGDGVYAVLLLWSWAADNCPATGRLEKMERRDIHTVCCVDESCGDFINDLMVEEFLAQDADGVFYLPNWREEQPHVAQAEERSEAARAKARKRWDAPAAAKKEQSADARPKPKQCRGNAAALPEQCSNTNSKAFKSPLPPKGGEGELVSVVMDAYREVLPELPEPVETEKVRRDIESRAKADPERANPEWWRGYFGRVRQSPHLMGGGSSGWRASLGWLVGGANMDKVLGGEYPPAPEQTGRPETESWSLEEFEQMQAAKPAGAPG